MVTRTRGLTDLMVGFGCGRPWERDWRPEAAPEDVSLARWGSGDLPRAFDLVQRTVKPLGLPAMTSQ